MPKKIKEEFVGWTFSICPKCGNIWSIYDKYGEFNEDFAHRKCPVCKAKKTREINKKRVADGKNKLSETKKRKPKKLEPSEKFLKDNNITDRMVIKEFKNILKRREGQRFTFNKVLKDAIEIAGYRLQEKMEK